MAHEGGAEKIWAARRANGTDKAKHYRTRAKAEQPLVVQAGESVSLEDENRQLKAKLRVLADVVMRFVMEVAE